MSRIRSLIRAGLMSVMLMTPCLAFSQDNTEESARATDLVFFRTEIFEVDASYSDEARQKATVLMDELELNAVELSAAQVELALAEIIALADNGHTFMMPGGWTVRYNRLPIRFGVFTDGIYVLIADDEWSRLTGYQLLEIDSKPIELIRDEWRRYQGGLDGWRNQFLVYFLESPEILFAAGMTASPDSLTLKLAGPGDEILSVNIPGNRNQPPPTGMDLYLAPSRILKAAAVAGPTAENLPLYLQNPELSYRFEALDDIDAAYIQFKSNSNQREGDDIEAFLARVTQELESSSFKHIIVDERFNVGGDLNITRKLMNAIPKYAQGPTPVFAITSGRTFSAAISSTAYLKQATGEDMIIVGEPVGDRLEFWAEGDLMMLPESGLAFLAATERHNYMTGCPEDDCHRPAQRNPIKIDTLEPDIYTPLNYEDFINNVDPAMVAVRARLAEAN